MEALIAFCIGITLSAACGFRIFLPPLAMSLASLHGELELSPELNWIGTYPAAIAFGTATAVEILAYYLPVVDNLLDAVEIPTAIVVGTLLTAATMGDVDPVLKWSLAAIAGGGTAGIIEGFTTTARLASTGLTGGLGNPVLSTTEALSSAILSILGLTLPLLAVFLVVFLLIFGASKILKFVDRRK